MISHDPSGAGAIPAPIDLSGVDPTRWDETRRRVAILREWCSRKRHPRSECERAAARMGVSIGQFVRLVATWKAHGDAVRVSGGNRRRGAALATSSLPPATRIAINDAIAAVGPAVAFTAIRDEVLRRCRDADSPAASDGMIHYLLMRARRDVVQDSDADGGRLLVGHVHVLLPVDDGNGSHAIPTLLLAVDERRRAVIAHRLLTDPAPWDKDLASLLDEVARRRSDVVGAIVVVAGDLSPPAGADVVREGGPRLLAPILGSHLDTLPLRHQRTRLGEVRKAPGDSVSVADAKLAVIAAITAHNGRLGIASAPE